MRPCFGPLKMFQSAPPVKGAMSVNGNRRRSLGVSIRAPREGGDSAAVVSRVLSLRFNPRPP